MTAANDTMTRTWILIAIPYSPTTLGKQGSIKG